ncbi:general stress protein [Propionibacteriaceae bacterium Y2011]
MAQSLHQPSSIFELEYPHSVAVYDSYAEAQKAVDFLADERFEVKNLCIVGTDLKSVERVLGRKSWGSVISNAAVSGVGTGLLIGLILLIFVQVPNVLVMLLVTIVMAILISMVFQSIAYAMSGGRRDFTSVSQTVATKYEVLCEHKTVQQARELLATMPGARAAAFTNPPPAQQPSSGPTDEV